MGLKLRVLRNLEVLKKLAMESKTITFANSNQAKLVFPEEGAKADDILKALGIKQPKALIIIIGGASGLDEKLKPPLEQLFSCGIAHAATEMGAMIIDGGTQAGVMAMMGKVVADQGRKSILLGVAPADKVTYPDGPAEGSIKNGITLDPNHTHFVLVESNEWGGETETMFQLAQELSKKVPVLTILVNGGEITKKEVLLSVRHGWPIIVIGRTGRLADEIAATLVRGKEAPDDDTGIIVNDGDIDLFDFANEPKALTTLIQRRLFEK